MSIVIAFAIVAFLLLSLWWLEYYPFTKEKEEKKPMSLEDLECVSDKLDGFSDKVDDFMTDWRKEVSEIKRLLSGLHHEMGVVEGYLRREQEEKEIEI